MLKYEQYVYRLNDETRKGKTYITRKNAYNVTTNYNLNVPLKCELKGKGTLSDPYLIGSLSDLRYFSDIVNKGYDFEGEYIRQVTDVDLKEEANWIPIGIIGRGNYLRVIMMAMVIVSEI